MVKIYKGFFFITFMKSNLIKKKVLMDEEEVPDDILIQLEMSLQDLKAGRVKEFHPKVRK